MIRISHTSILAMLLAVCVFAANTPSNAQNTNEIVVIANKSVKANSISISEVKRIFLKEKGSLSGERITPINAKNNSALRKAFAQKALGMSTQEETSYWEDQKIKSGTRKPTELSNTIKAIFSVKNGISYCYRKDFNPAVAKILLVL